MSSPLSSVIAARLEKAAVDNGFDRELPAVGEWLAFASTQSPLRIWLGMTLAGNLTIAFSLQNASMALVEVESTNAEGCLRGRSLPESFPTSQSCIRWRVDRSS